MTTHHRVSLLRSSLRRYPDPARSRDPQVRAVVDQLARLPVAPGPDPAFRNELRAQLVAIAPRMVSEGAEQIAREAATATDTAKDPAEEADEAPGRARRRERTERRHWSLGRGLKVATVSLAVLVLLLGGTVWWSRSALPGDSLYGLKRASENVQLSFASSDTAKAADYLQFAQTRAGEVKALLARSTTSALGANPSASGAVDPQTEALIVQTLDSSNSDVRSAAGLLGRAALQEHSVSPLTAMTSWAPGQLARLSAISTDLPLGQLRTQAAASKALVAAAQHRAVALHRLVGCACMSGARSDQLGPVPCTSCSTPASTPGSQPSSHPGSHTGTSTKPKVSRSGTARTNGSSAPGSGGRVSGGSGKTKSGASSTPGPSLPGLPLPKLPSAPVKAGAGSCGISVSVLGIKVSIGTCSSPHK